MVWSRGKALGQCVSQLPQGALIKCGHETLSRDSMKGLVRRIRRFYVASVCGDGRCSEQRCMAPARYQVDRHLCVLRRSQERTPLALVQEYGKPNGEGYGLAPWGMGCRWMTGIKYFSTDSIEGARKMFQEALQKKAEDELAGMTRMVAAARDKGQDGHGKGISEEEDGEKSWTDVAEIGGPKVPEPTRYGDWERGGRCSDF